MLSRTANNMLPDNTVTISLLLLILPLEILLPAYAAAIKNTITPYPMLLSGIYSDSIIFAVMADPIMMITRLLRIPAVSPAATELARPVPLPSFPMFLSPFLICYCVRSKKRTGTGNYPSRK